MALQRLRRWRAERQFDERLKRGEYVAWLIVVITLSAVITAVSAASRL